MANKLENFLEAYADGRIPEISAEELTRDWRQWENVESAIKTLIDKLGRFPKSDELRSSCKGLESAAQRYHGGLRTVAVRMGYDLARKPEGYWQNWENVERELRRITKENNGSLPSEPELNKLGHKSLAAAISKFGGFSKIRAMLGLEILKSPNGCWKKLDAVEDELRKVIESLGHFPSQTELRNLGKSGLGAAIIQHGGINEVRKIMGYGLIEFEGEKYADWKEVELALSPLIKALGKFPSAIDLRKRGLNALVDSLYKYHGGINKSRERFGYSPEMNEAEYGTKKELLEGLEELWKEHPELKREIPPDNWMRKNGYQALGHAIYRHHGGFSKVRKELGKKSVQAYGRGELASFKRISEIIGGIQKEHPEFNGELPSRSWLNENGYPALVNAVNKYHGGFREFRDKLGVGQLRKEDGYWQNWENVIKELDNVIAEHSELSGKLPSSHWLRTKGYGYLIAAILLHGKYEKVRSSFNAPSNQKPRGYWKVWDNVRKEFYDVVKKFGYLPSGYELTRDGYSSLVSSAQYYGGLLEVKRRLESDGVISSGGKLEGLLKEYAGGENE